MEAADQSRFHEFIERAEREFGGQLAGELRSELAVLHDVRCVIFEGTRLARAAASSQTYRGQAAAALASRIINDLRLMKIAIELGYLQQAATLAAGMADAAFTMGAVADDEVRAQDWVEHQTIDASSVRVKRAILLTCEATFPPSQVQDRRAFYLQLYSLVSSIKHANGRVLSVLGLDTRATESVRVVLGPSAGGRVTQLASIVTLVSADIAMRGATSFFQSHLTSHPHILEEVATLQQKVHDMLIAMHDATLATLPSEQVGDTVDESAE